MRKSDVSELLTFIALFDKRKVGDPDVEAWYLVLGDVDALDARDAVVDWFKDHSREWLMPADIRRFVGEVRADRLARNPVSADELTEAAALDGDEYRRQLRALRDAHSARPAQLRAIQ